MTDQSTPTPTDDLNALIHRLVVYWEDYGCNLEELLNVNLAGWKSTAEVAELVRAAAEEAWDESSADAVEYIDVPNWRQSDNPYSKPTPETVPSDV